MNKLYFLIVFIFPLILFAQIKLKMDFGTITTNDNYKIEKSEPNFYLLSYTTSNDSLKIIKSLTIEKSRLKIKDKDIKNFSIYDYPLPNSNEKNIYRESYIEGITRLYEMDLYYFIGSKEYRFYPGNEYVEKVAKYFSYYFISQGNLYQIKQTTEFYPVNEQKLKYYNIMKTINLESSNATLNNIIKNLKK